MIGSGGDLRGGRGGKAPRERESEEGDWSVTYTEWRRALLWFGGIIIA